MNIPYVNLSAQWKDEKQKLLPLIEQTLRKGIYVGGKEVLAFEKKVSKICGSKYAVALNSGTDALTMGLYALGIKKNDEIITPPNSFISSTTSIWHIGAKPVFVDVLEDQNINPDLIEKAITKKTKAIMPVHLTGRMCEMNEIKRIANKYGIHIIEDAAQSIGSKYYNKLSGTFGEFGCFSAHPLKNLNACGDAGFLITNNYNYYKKIILLRSHGLENRNLVKNFGFLSRMDVLQAKILNFRLNSFKNIILKRRKNANFYLKNINREFYNLMDEKKYQFNTYHTFVIQTNRRKELIKYLKKNKIETVIHYPIPIHLQPASKYLGYSKGSFPVTERLSKKILTLPIHQYLKVNDLKRIVKCLNKFADFKKK